MVRPLSAIASRDGLAIACATVLALCLAACAPPPVVAPEALPAAPSGFPDADYRQLAAQGRPVFRVEPALSLVTLEVHRAGSLARIGHDHVIAARDWHGYVAPDDSRADLYLRLDELTVDEPELRAQAQLDTHPTPEDIAGTRRNMLNGFEAARYPFAQVRIRGAATEGGEAPLEVAVSLHGTTHSFEVPVRASRSGDEFAATGALTLRQTDFGIAPLSVLGGALQVQDVVDVRFSIRARRVR
jgi:hypothetical protein